MDTLKPNQLTALKKLESALLSVKRAGLVLVGIDGSLMASVEDDELIEAVRRSATTEVILARHNSGHPLAYTVNSYGCYRDSGGA